MHVAAGHGVFFGWISSRDGGKRASDLRRGETCVDVIGVSRNAAGG